MARFKLEALRHFGTELPVAVLRVNGESGIYDLSGVRDLMAQYRDLPDYPVLAEIERAMLVPGNYSDLNEDDFSGQVELFESD